MTEENEQAETPVFSKIFPTEIRYQTSEGAIQSVWVKEAGVVFQRDTDEDGNIIGNRLIIQLEVNDITTDVVIQDYAQPIQFVTES